MVSQSLLLSKLNVYRYTEAVSWQHAGEAALRTARLLATAGADALSPDAGLTEVGSTVVTPLHCTPIPGRHSIGRTSMDHNALHGIS
jgi:hypothetical protein